MDFSAPIIVADDYPEMTRLVRSHLEEFGFDNVLVADGGAGALHLARSSPVRLIIADYKMPMSGLHLLKEIRLDPALCELPFIMMSGHTDRTLVEEARRAGVNHFLVKPFTKAALQAKVAAIFQAEQHAAEKRPQDDGTQGVGDMVLM